MSNFQFTHALSFGGGGTESEERKKEKLKMWAF